VSVFPTKTWKYQKQSNFSDHFVRQALQDKEILKSQIAAVSLYGAFLF
jgi:hypothetical protein